jgi:hypothetical protein
MVEWEYRKEGSERAQVGSVLCKERFPDTIPQSLILEQYLDIKNVRIGEKLTPLSRSFVDLLGK